MIKVTAQKYNPKLDPVEGRGKQGSFKLGFQEVSFLFFLSFQSIPKKWEQTVQ